MLPAAWRSHPRGRGPPTASRVAHGAVQLRHEHVVQSPRAPDRAPVLLRQALEVGGDGAQHRGGRASVPRMRRGRRQPRASSTPGAAARRRATTAWRARASRPSPSATRERPRSPRGRAPGAATTPRARVGRMAPCSAPADCAARRSTRSLSVAWSLSSRTISPASSRHFSSRNACPSAIVLALVAQFEDHAAAGGDVAQSGRSPGGARSARRKAA